MSTKVVWQDGMFICPQHFQQQDKYYEHLIKINNKMQSTYHYGILDLEIDKQLLLTNKVHVRRCNGILPDGSTFDINKNDNCIVDIPKNYSGFVYLAVPIQESIILKSTSMPDKLSTYKYVCYEKNIHDDIEPDNIQQITIGRLNVSLLLQDNNLNSVIYLPIIKIIDSSNNILLDNKYIPPILTINYLLKQYIQNIILTFRKYLSTFSIESNYSSVEIAIAQTTSKYLYKLEVLLSNTNTTAYKLFDNLVSLLGSLAIFSKDKINVENITYNHNDLYLSFHNVIQYLNNIFINILDTNNVSTLLLEKKDNIYVGKIPHDLNFEYIILKIDLIDTKQIEIQNSLKIASEEDMNDIIQMQISGVNFELLKTLPAFIPYDKSSLYCKIIPHDHFWKNIIKHNNLAAYINASVKQIKLWLINEGQR